MPTAETYRSFNISIWPGKSAYEVLQFHLVNGPGTDLGGDDNLRLSFYVLDKGCPWEAFTRGIVR